MLEYIKYAIKRPMDALHKLSDIGEITTWGSLLTETFMQQRYTPLYNIIKPNTTVIDIGAFRGVTAVYFAMNLNVIEVIAIEPSASFDIMIKFTNKFKKIKAMKCGVSEIQGDGIMNDNSFSRQYGNKNYGKAISLNELIKGKTNVVIKCDCEGNERNIFTKNADLTNVYAIEMQWHDTEEEMIKILKSKGFTVKVLERQKGIITYKSVGYILAYREED